MGTLLISKGSTVIGKKHEVQSALRKKLGFYTYILRRPNKEAFYVGKGKGFRVFNHEIEADGGKKSYKCNVIRQIRESAAEILYEIDLFHADEGIAFARERHLIQMIGRADLNQGPLTNLTDGGEGSSNPSPVSKEKHRITLGGVSSEGTDSDIVNACFQSIHPRAPEIGSIPVKPLSKFKPSTARENKKPESRKAFLRQGLALLVSARMHGLSPLVSGCRIPRRFVVDGVPAIIENGVLSRLLNSSLVDVERGHKVDEEVLILTDYGFERLRPYFNE